MRVRAAGTEREHSEGRLAGCRAPRRSNEDARPERSESVVKAAWRGAGAPAIQTRICGYARPERSESVMKAAWRGCRGPRHSNEDARPERSESVVKAAWRGAGAP